MIIRRFCDFECQNFELWKISDMEKLLSYRGTWMKKRGEVPVTPWIATVLQRLYKECNFQIIKMPYSYLQNNRLRVVYYFALKSVKRTRTRYACEPLVSCASVPAKRETAFIQHPWSPVPVWQLTSSMPTPAIYEHDTLVLDLSKRSPTSSSKGRCNEQFHPKEASWSCKAVCVKCLTFM